MAHAPILSAYHARCLFNGKKGPKYVQIFPTSNHLSKIHIIYQWYTDHIPIIMVV